MHRKLRGRSGKGRARNGGDSTSNAARHPLLLLHYFFFPPFPEDPEAASSCSFTASAADRVGRFFAVGSSVSLRAESKYV